VSLRKRARCFIWRRRAGSTSSGFGLMDWRKDCLANFRLYAITDLGREGPDIIPRLRQALRGGVDVIQLRSKTLSDAALIRLGTRIRVMTRKLRKLFVVNDRPDLALAVDSDGVHLGQEDVPIRVARRIMNQRDKIIGRSTHSLAQAFEAQREGADYIGFGPIFKTPTKPTYEPLGLGLISRLLGRIRIPVVLIGGIDRSNVEQVIASGGERIAVVRAIFSRRDPYRAAKELKGFLTGA